MKNKFLVSIGFIFALGISDITLAVQMNCKKFSSEANELSSSTLKKSNQLASIEKQIQSNSKAIDDYNKNCRVTSGPSCNPTMYDIISGQMTELTGRRQQLQIEIADSKTKQVEATKHLKMCKAVKIKGSTL